MLRRPIGQALVEPRAAGLPFPFDRRRRDAECLRGLAKGEAPEKPQLRHLRLSRIQRCQFRQGSIQIKDINIAWLALGQCIVERHASLPTGPLDHLPASRAVDENATHHHRGDPEELRPVLPGRVVLIDQPNVRLVHERRRLQRVAGALAPQICRRPATQLLINEWD